MTIVPVDGTGRVDPDDVRRAITPRHVPRLGHARQQRGRHDPADRRDRARSRASAGVLIHTDAAQSVGKIPTHVDELGVDLLSIAGHKVYAPKGVGALYIRRGVRLEPLIHGAGHESGRRAGTESALLDAALGEACAIARDLAPMDGVRALRDRLWDGLRSLFGDARRAQRPPDRTPAEHAQRLVRRPPGRRRARGARRCRRLDGLGLPRRTRSSSRRCSLAMGVEPRVGMGAVRLSLGRMTTDDEIDAVLSRFARQGDSVTGTHDSSIGSRRRVQDVHGRDLADPSPDQPPELIVDTGAA